jgi:hypothetical protein
MVTTEKSYSKRLLHLISWSHWFTFFNIWAAIGLSTLYLFSEPLPETLLGIVYLGATWLSHMAFLTFISFILIVFPLTIVFPKTGFIRSSASIIFTLGLLLLVLDAFIYSRLGYHLNASSKNQIIALINNEISSNSVLFWLTSAVLFIVVLTFELLASNYAWKHLKQLQATRFARKIVMVLVGAFFFSHIVHIWADAKLDYNVLKQDTLLPLSYPTTAKALLTKYGLFNRENYMERRNSPLAFTEKVKPYPTITEQCLGNQLVKNKQNYLKQSVFIVLNDQLLTDQERNTMANRVFNSALVFNHHIDNAIGDDAWFNLFYSLPSIYQQDILAQGKLPAVFQLLKQQKLTATYTQISDKNSDTKLTLPTWLQPLFDRISTADTISKLVFSNKLSELPIGLHVIRFNTQDNYQFELFIDALQLAQRSKNHPDIIWASSFANKDQTSSLTNKSAFLSWPGKSAQQVNTLTSQMDLMPTLIKNWLGCKVEPNNYSTGTDLLRLKYDRVIANTTANGLVVFNKDKSVFIDQNGNFQSYSRQLNAPIVETADFPMMIDGVHYIKQFTQAPNKQK